MKISIITVCYNSEKTIDDTIQSVLAQSYKNIEYIIIDGGSTDKTLSIINKHRTHISVVVSEPDKGIYDAMNKGIALATGDIIGILNSDDVFFDDTTIEKVARSFIVSKADAVFGNIYYVRADNIDSIVRFWKASKYKRKAFQKGWHPPHPSFFVKKSVYQAYGAFDTSFNISADFELMLRFIGKHDIETVYLNEVLVKMRIGGTSNKNIKNIITGNVNIKRAFRKNDIRYPFYYPAARILPKLLQFIKR